jgi:hypothetical protein
VKRLLAICLVVTALLSAAPAGAQSSPAFVFGRRGGTIMPFQVQIFGDGRVSVTGAVHRTENVTVSPEAIQAVRTLAKAQRFFSMPAFTRCPGVVGGLATNYIRIRIGRLDKTVAAYGRCNKRFAGLFEVLQAVAGVSTAPRTS